jgi:hypothetical protein
VTAREWSVERRRRPREGRRRGISRPWISPREKRTRKFHCSRASPRELRRRPNFSRASSGSASLPKNETLARFARARRGREGEMAGWGRLPPRGPISNTVKWPSWAWPAVRSPYQTRPMCHKLGLNDSIWVWDFGLDHGYSKKKKWVWIIMPLTCCIKGSVNFFINYM